MPISTLTSRRQFLTILGASAAAAGCGRAAAGGPPSRRTTTLRYQGWAGQVTLPELAADLGYLGDVKLDWVGNTISGPQDIQSAATGQIDVGGAFNGAVVKLAARQAPITAVISYYGVDQLEFNGFYVREDSPIRAARDLLGAKVAMNTLGAHDEAMLDIYLQRNGLSAAQIGKVEPVALPPVNTEQAVRAKQVDVGVLEGIWRDAALASGGLRLLFSDYQLLGSFSAGTYVMTKNFLRTNPDTARTFVTGVARTIEWTRTTPRAEVISRMTDIVHRRGRSEDANALRYWKSEGVAEPGGRVTDQEFQIWIDWLSKRGDIPRNAVTASALYTNEFNDYRPSGAPASVRASAGGQAIA
jgi:ABC-type nitrate/sulfonate/bicarbonate transport system substrate-binding protein